MAVNDYCTIAEVKAVLADTVWGTSYDTLLTVLASRASRSIDRALGREPGAFYVTANTTRYFDGSGERELWVGELAAVPDSVAVSEDGSANYITWEASDYIPWPYNALAEGQPYVRLDVDQMNGSHAIWYKFPRGVKIVGKFGYSTTVPEDIKQVAIAQVLRWFKVGQQAYAELGSIEELGQWRFSLLDADLTAIVEHLRRVAI